MATIIILLLFYYYSNYNIIATCPIVFFLKMSKVINNLKRLDLQLCPANIGTQHLVFHLELICDLLWKLFQTSYTEIEF